MIIIYTYFYPFVSVTELISNNNEISSRLDAIPESESNELSLKAESQ
jgi:hypothetical protein